MHQYFQNFLGPCCVAWPLPYVVVFGGLTRMRKIRSEMVFYSLTLLSPALIALTYPKRVPIDNHLGYSAGIDFRRDQNIGQLESRGPLLGSSHFWQSFDFLRVLSRLNANFL
jgi:hypothetical protein